MFTLIHTDIIRRIKNPLTGFLILIILFMAALEIQEIDTERELRSFIMHDVYNFSQSTILDYSVFIEDPDDHPKAYEATQLLAELHEQINSAVEVGDTDELLRLYTFYNLVYTRAGFGDHDRILQLVFDKKMMSIWKDVANGRPYDSIEPFWSISNDSIDQTELSLEYYHYLYKNKLRPTYHDEVNNITYLYAYFFNHLPKLIIIAGILLMYNTINHHKNTGSLKLILTQSMNRTKVYLANFISGTFHMILTLLVPPVLISMTIGVWRGFVSFNYPVTALANIMTSLTPIANYFDTISEKGQLPILPYTFSYFAPKGPLVDLLVPNGKLEWIPAYQFFIFAILLSIFFILFITAFTLLISSLIDHEIISFITSAIMYGGFFLIGLDMTQGLNESFSPFNMFNASRILIGTANTTGLKTLLILFTSTLILLILGLIHFRRKEI